MGNQSQSWKVIYRNNSNMAGGDHYVYINKPTWEEAHSAFYKSRSIIQFKIYRIEDQSGNPVYIEDPD